MPFPFVLPTTSAFSFSSSFGCESHPSLPLNASTYRGVVRDDLKKHKRLAPASQAASLSLVVSNINAYLPYLFAVDAGLARRSAGVPGGGGGGDEVSVVLNSAPVIEWRPTLSSRAVPGREAARTKVRSLEYELSFALSTLGYAHTLLARAALHPLHVTSGAPPPDGPARAAAITAATKHLLDAASVHDWLARRAEKKGGSPAAATTPPCPDITPAAARAMASLALAEATLLAVLKDDPYPAVAARDRNDSDREWMYKAPEIPRVRAHLYARLCLAAADHAAQASSLCHAARASSSSSDRGLGRLDDVLLRYLEDLRRAARAKACRFLGIDAELSGQMGDALGWLRCGLLELGVESREVKKGLSLSRMRKDWSERKEDRKVHKSTNWGADAGRVEEIRVLEMLETKWAKVNDTMLTQSPTAPQTLLAKLPSGREFNTIQPWQPPELDRLALEAMRAPPDRSDDFGAGAGDQLSSDDEGALPGAEDPVGAFPGTQDQYRAEGTRSYY